MSSNEKDLAARLDQLSARLDSLELHNAMLAGALTRLATERSLAEEVLREDFGERTRETTMRITNIERALGVLVSNMANLPPSHGLVQALRRGEPMHLSFEPQEDGRLKFRIGTLAGSQTFGSA